MYCLEEKPEKEIRQLLKNEYAFRWSRRNKAWQRKLTAAGIHAAEQATGASIESKPAPEVMRTALPPVSPVAAPQLQLPF